MTAEVVLRGESTPASKLVREVWDARPLLGMLARKDFFVRYRRASFGLLWAVALPLFQAAILALVLSRVVKIHTPVNYAVFVFAGMVVWAYFAASLQTASTAIVDGSDLSTKIYFPRAVLPLVPVISTGYGLVLSVVVLLVMAMAVGAPLGTNLLLLPPAVVLAGALTASLALVLAALHVYFRDVRYLVQAALLAWFYVTPVFYPLQLARGLAPWIRANPVTGAVELMRAATVGADPGWLPAVWWSLGWTAALLVVALALHRRYDRVFVDLL